MFHGTWILAFLTTVTIEISVALIWARLAKCKAPILELLIVNLITHPAAFVLSATSLAFSTIEFLVIVVEALGYRVAVPLPWRKAITLALVTNLVSMSLSFF